MTGEIKISTGLSWRTCAYACAFTLLVGLGLGAWGMHTWQVSDLRQQLAVMAAKLKHAEEKPPVVKETVKTVTDTQIAYVPKETVVYRDPVTGQTSEQQMDGKMTFNKPEFMFTVNGKPGKFTKTDDERFVFDKNMMKITQASTIRIEAEIPTVDKTRSRTALLDAVVEIKDRRVHPGASFQYTNKSGLTIGAGVTFDGSHARIGAGWSF